jgi:transposase InsO family protein
LGLKVSTLSEWSQLFDEGMTPLVMLDERGKRGKVTVEAVRKIVAVAKDMRDKGQRLRLKSFTRRLSTEAEISLSSKTVADILVANDLYRVSTRRRRPGFYQKLKQSIPNGLISVDGSEFKVIVDGVCYEFNLELAVDVQSYLHSGFSVSGSETAEEVIRVIEAHRALWGSPLAMVADHGSGNLSDEVKAYLASYQIELLPAGPGNPKGNGTAESAFSGMKEVVGSIVLNSFSPALLAKSVLEKIVSVYIAMRNRLPLFGDRQSPEEIMSHSASPEARQQIGDHYKKRAQKQEDPDHQRKLDRIDWLIRYHNLKIDEPSLKRAQTCIGYYDPEAIAKSEEAFLTSVRRDQNRRTLPYFFGILKRVQKEMDEQKHKDYCYKRYNEQQMRERERQKHQEMVETAQPTTIENLVAMLQEVLKKKAGFIRETSIRLVKQMLQNLKNQYQYLEVLKKKISDALGEVQSMNLSQRQEAFNLVEQYLA